MTNPLILRSIKESEKRLRTRNQEDNGPKTGNKRLKKSTTKRRESQDSLKKKKVLNLLIKKNSKMYSEVFKNR